VITEDEFAAWKADPVTEGVLEALAAMAEAQKEGWLSASWEGGTADSILLCELKTRADAYSALAQGSYEDFFQVTE
jgi:hypothetical protein